MSETKVAKRGLDLDGNPIRVTGSVHNGTLWIDCDIDDWQELVGVPATARRINRLERITEKQQDEMLIRLWKQNRAPQA
jgi:hypothetical protein